MKARIVLASIIVLYPDYGLRPISCDVPCPALPTAVPAPVAQDGWQTYTNPQASASAIPPPGARRESRSKPETRYQTVTLQGTDGEVDLHWGVGFGGACPQGYTTVKVAQGELPACYTKNADGTEVWAQIGKELEATSFSADARTKNADPANHDLVLAVLATLSFPPPEQSTRPSDGPDAHRAERPGRAQPVELQLEPGRSNTGVR